MEKRIGLSLSLCIRDILHNIVRVEQVEKIIAGTRITNDVEFAEVCDHYFRTYWSGDVTGVIIATRLWDAGKIEQPRLADNSVCHSIADGHWQKV